MKRFFRVTALALIAAFMIESDAQAAFAAGAPDADRTLEASDYEWTGDAEEDAAVSTGSAEELESRFTASGTETRKPFGVGPISPTQVTAQEAGGIISVKNNLSDTDIYVAPVEQSFASATQTSIVWVRGFKVEPGETRLIYSGMYKADNEQGYEKKNLEKGKTYMVYAGIYNYMGIGQTEGTDENKETYWDEDVSYIDSISIQGEYSTEGLPKDGKEIKFKAVTQKNGKVKVSWSPKKNLGYKRYNLYRLVNDENDPANEWKALKNGTKSKNYTDKKETVIDPDTGVKEIVLKTAVYKLECILADGSTEAYIAVATPRLYYAETGYDNGYAEFCVSGYAENEDLDYVTMTAAKKGEYKKENGIVAKTVVNSVETGWTIDYNVSKTVKVRAVRPYHNTTNLGEDYQLKLGNSAVYKASVRYDYKGQIYESGASNAISRKVGPAKCYIAQITGVDPADLFKSFAEENDTVSGLQGFHHSSTGTCYKHGYIAFYGIKNHVNVSRYELLRSTTPYGKYKVVKKYSLDKVKAVAGMDDMSYVEYNNFPPETTYYYAIRAVYGRSAYGGFGDGVENRTEFDKVQNAVAYDTGKGSCTVEWEHDDCAKEYWIYRADGDIVYDKETDKYYYESFKERTDANGGVEYDVVKEEIADGLGAFHYVGKVKGNKTKIYPELGTTKYNSFTDKKGLTLGKTYSWIVRPVYKTGSKKALTEQMKTYLSDPSAASPTLVLAQAKQVKVSRYSIGQLKLTWSYIHKQIDRYEIQWTTDKSKLLQAGDAYYTWENTSWGQENTVVITKADADKKGGKTNNPAYIIDVEPGKKYYFRVRGFSADGIPTEWDEMSCDKSTASTRDGNDTASGKTAPMPVKTLKVTRLSGDYFHRGGKISLELNENDKEWLKDNNKTGSMRYKITYEDNDQNRSSGTITESHKLESASGASYSDEEKDLARGVTRKYNVSLIYNLGGGSYIEGETKSVYYSKPRGLYITDTDGNEISTITLAPDNSEYTFRVYAYTDTGNKTGSQATVRDLDRCASLDTDIVKLANRNDNSGYTTVTIKAGKSGTTKIKIDAFGSSWKGDGADGDNLTKTLTVTVK